MDGGNKVGWLVASGDKKGHVVITRGAFSAHVRPSKKNDLLQSDGLESVNLSSRKVRGRKTRSSSSERVPKQQQQQQEQQQQEKFTSISITALIGAGAVTCLTLTKKKVPGSTALTLNSVENYHWDHLVIGTSLGRMAVVDVLSAQVSVESSECVPNTLSSPSNYLSSNLRENRLFISY